MDFFDAVENPTATPPQPSAQPQSAPQRGDFFDAVERPQEYLQSRASTFDPQEQRLRETKAKYAGQGEDVGRFILRNMLPGASSAFNYVKERQYRKAQERYDAGQATQEDLDVIAQNQRLAEIQANEGTGRTILRSLASVPAIAGEFAMAGPLLGKVPTLAGRAAATPFVVPSMGFYQDVERRARENKSLPTDIENLAPAYGLAAANAAVLGRMQARIAASPKTTLLGKLAQAGKVGAVGVGEAQAVKTLAYDVDQALDAAGVNPKARTGETGAFVKFLKGEHGEAMKELAVEWVTFTAFAGLHGRKAAETPAPGTDIVRLGRGEFRGGNPGGRPEIPGGSGKGEHFDAFVKAFQWMRGNGLKDSDAKAYMEAVVAKPIRDAFARNPNMPFSEAVRMFDHLPDSPLKDLAVASARAWFRPTVRQTGAPTPGERPAEPPVPDAEIVGPKQIGTPPRIEPTEVQPTAESEGKATEPPTTPAEQRRKEIDRSLHDNLLELPDDATDGQIGQAFQKAGYRLIDGFWVHPDVDPAYVAAISPAAKERMQEHGIYYINEVGGTVFGQQAGGHAAGVVVGGRTMGGIGVNSQGEGIKGGTFAGQDRIALHETAHHVWSGLSPEQKALFEKAHPTTAYAKQHAGGNLAAEENFTERFADNKGDLEKTLREAEATEPPTTPAEPTMAETGTEPTRTPESPPESAQELSTATGQSPRGPDRRAKRFVSSEQAAEQEAIARFGKETVDYFKDKGWLASDILTGFREGRTGLHRHHTIQRAIDWTRETGEEGSAHLINADLKNLGGLNAELGDVEANKVYRRITDVFEEELKGTGAEVVPYRHGGDEFSAVVVGAKGPEVDAALRRAEKRIAVMNKTEGWYKIEHPKFKGKRDKRGTGITSARVEVKGNSEVEPLLKDVGLEVEHRKKGAPDRRQAPEVPAEAETQRQEVPGRIDVEAEFDRAGLTGTERYALGQALRGQGLRKIAADPKFTKLYGRETNQQTVANILGRAGKKLGAPDIRAKVEEVLASERADRAAELVEQGGRAAEDLLGDGDAVRGVEKKVDAWDKATADIEAIAEQMLKEAESGRLTPERKAELEAQALAAHRAASGGQPGEKPKAPGVAGKVEGKAPRTPSKPKLTGKRKPAEPAADAGVRKPKWATKESGLGEVLGEFDNAEGRTKEALEGALMNAGFLDGEGKPEKNPYEDYSAGERKQQLGRELASAHDYMDRYGQDTAPIERALEAIGAEREGTPGEVIPFNPAAHEDVPGLSTGTPVKVLRSGWAVPREGGGFETVTKAKVEPPSEPPTTGQARRFGGGPRGRAGKLVIPDLRNSAIWQAIKKGGLALKRFVVRWLTSFGDLGPAVFRAKIAMDSRIAAYAQDVLNASRDFYRAVGDYKKLTAAEVGAIRAALEGDAAALAGLKPEVATAVRSMRAHIDALSNVLIKVGAIQGKLAGAVDENLGVYLHRSYQVFKDPKWADKVSEDVKNKFKAWLRAEYIRAGHPRSEAEIEGVMWKLLTNGTAAENPIAFLSRSKLGSKDLGIITRRKDVPPELRALWGEVTDPLATYAETITRQAHMLANHVFQKQVAEIGLREGFLSRTPTKERPVEIAPEGSEVMGPLAGLHTTPEMKRAFGEVYAKDQLPAGWAVARTLLGLAKYSKTVLSPVTHLRNFFGGAFAALANGHYRLSAMIPTIRTLATDTPASRKAFRRMVELGLIGEGIGEREMKQFSADILRMRQNDATTAMGRLVGKLRSGVGLAEKAYRTEDAFWKLYFFENEKANYKKAHPEWTERQVEEKAAEIVRNTYQTYSMIPKAVKAQRLNPVTAPFLAFPSEVIRNTYHTVRLGVAEMKDPATRDIGIRRLIGLGAALGLAGTLGAVTRNMNGLTTDDEDAMRRFLPWWSRNSELVHLGQSEDGHRRYIDLGSTDYYAFLKRPVIAALGDSPENAIYELADPVLGEQLFAERFLNVARNQKREGGPVVNPQMPWEQRKLAQAQHLGGALVPGVAESARRLGLASQGEQYDLGTEVGANVTGQRVQALDVPKSLGFKARRFDRAMSDAANIYSRGEGDLAMVDSIRRGLFEEMRADVLAAEQLGMNRSQTFRLLRDSGISEENVRMILSGSYRSWRPSERLEKSRATRLAR